MAKDLKLANETVNAQADALARKLDNGYLRIYSGAKPATADTAIGAQVLLAELRFANPSAPAANATGQASFFRALKADGASSVWDGNVGLVGSNSDLELDAVDISANADVEIDSWQHTVPKNA